MTHRRLRSLAAATAVPTLTVLALAAPASAHVTVNPNTATAGGYAKLTFRVPTESDTAATTKLAVYFPTDQPFASVSVKPHPGWSFKVTDKKLAQPISSDDGQVTEAVSRILWKADSAASVIRPGEFDEFDISLGPLPGSGSLQFKALQTYSDGSVVRWIDTAQPGQPEPDHPAPLLTIVPANAASGTASAVPSVTVSSAPGADGTTSTAATAVEQDSSHTALILSVIALVVAAGGAGLSVVRRRG